MNDDFTTAIHGLISTSIVVGTVVLAALHRIQPADILPGFGIAAGLGVGGPFTTKWGSTRRPRFHSSDVVRQVVETVVKPAKSESDSPESPASV